MQTHRRILVAIAAACVTVAAHGCTGAPQPTDAASDRAIDAVSAQDGVAAIDSPGSDTPRIDAAASDTPVIDTGGAVDSGPGDTGNVDTGAADTGTPDSGPPPMTGCPALPAATGTLVRVTPAMANMLPAIAAAARSGTTILLEDGTYRMTVTGESSRRIQFNFPGVTMRSLSNNAAMVIIDGEYQTNEMITVSASNVTLAHFTVTHAIDHPIHVSPPTGGPDITGDVLYGLRIIDGGEQFVKVNSNGAGNYADRGRVECSFFQLTNAGRLRVERTPGGCYTGGIDCHSGRDWLVRQNRFEDIYCAGEGLAEHAVHFWVGARDTIVENNVIVNCARGVGFGLVESGPTRTYPDNPFPGIAFVGHYGGTIRNNSIFASIAFYDTGIELDQARDTRVFHNTVYSTAAATGFFSSIDYRFANTRVDIRNNLTVRITQRDMATGTVANNLEAVPGSYFVAPASADFHLASAAVMAIDRGVVVPEAGLDLDGQMHTRGAPDLGADEFQP